MSAPRLLFDTNEAAEMLGICKKTLLRHVMAGELRFVLIGNRTRKFTKADIEAFIEERRQCQSSARKTRRTINMNSTSKVVGFAERRARQIAERQKQLKPD